MATDNPNKSDQDKQFLRFISQISHELLAPLTEMIYDNDFIVNFAERDPDNISKRHLISALRENINKSIYLKHIINELTYLYSPSEKSSNYNIVKQDNPKRILLDAILLLEKDAHSKGISIRTNISEMPPIYFDKDRMMQVFLNLLKNAIRYADCNTDIDIFYNKKEDGFHEIRFTNFGIGIQEDEKEAIFELFYRGKEATNKFQQGTGTGLYIVRDIMRAHGGDCYVRCLNNPTEFVITLPNKH